MPHRRNVDMDLLRSFVTIVEVKSFTRAADRMLRTQSAISLQVKRLEEQLGSRLFERGGRGVEPTEAGVLLLGYARRILAENDELVGRMAEPQIEGAVSIGAPDDFSAEHLAPALARFSRAFPQVALNVTCALSADLRRDFTAGSYDMVLAYDRDADPAEGAVWREQLVWVAGEGIWDADEAVLPLVTAPAPSLLRKVASEALDAAQRPWRVAYVSSSRAGTLAAISAGLGIGILPRGSLVPGVVALERDSGLPPLPVASVHLYHRPNSSLAAQRLADFLNHVLGGKG
jgi:DNA-binding transcriptional LysR family regulator